MQGRVVIFGGSGFIGSKLTTLLLNNNFAVTVVCSNLKKAFKTLPKHSNLCVQKVDLFCKDDLTKVITDQDIVINLIGKLHEVQKDDFVRFHTYFASLLASLVTNDKKLIHISALGTEQAAATSKYAKTKLDGEAAVCNLSQNYVIIRPSLVFGKGDGFFNLFSKMSKFSPFLPLIGGGKTNFAPVFIEDLTMAILAIINNWQSYKNTIIQAAGPQKASFKSILQFILQSKGRKRALITLPFAIANLQAKLLNLFNIKIITPDQVELLKYNNLPSDKYLNIDCLIKNPANFKALPCFF